MTVESARGRRGLRDATSSSSGARARSRAAATSSRDPIDVGGIDGAGLVLPRARAPSSRTGSPRRSGSARRRVRIASPVITSGPILGTLAEVAADGKVDVAGVVDATQIEEVYGQWRAQGAARRWKLTSLAQVFGYADFTGKRSTPYRPGSVHDYMHAKVTVADDVAFVGSFNLSHSGEMNAENVLEIGDAALCERLGAFIDEVRGRYPPRRCRGFQNALKENDMQITRNSIETAAGPSDWFTGAVYIDAVAAPSEPSRVQAAQRPLHARRPDRVAHPSLRPDHLRHRGRRPLPAPRRAGRGHPPGRPRLLRARRGPLARRRPQPLHDPPRDAGGRRRGQPRRPGASTSPTRSTAPRRRPSRHRPLRTPASRAPAVPPRPARGLRGPSPR